MIIIFENVLNVSPQAVERGGKRQTLTFESVTFSIVQYCSGPKCVLLDL